ncbi:glycosyltransferase family 4 protein [Paraburkholderia sp. J11-2]|uniref:glycosyltransferase family 4 protein n=1 Tax=Paraburkholderia sp. J11-2 TaxID=2805431 RepID=UPI002AB6416C|nr:glycosyltransferase family 4 protein [Paraburkholderia sp. J11-2]
MHIAIFTRVLPHHSIGGMQTVAWDLARAFSRGNRVTLVTTEIPGRPCEFEDERVHIVTIPGAAWKRYDATWWRGARGVFERIAPSCNAVLGVSAAANSLLSLRGRYPELAFVMQAHGTSLGEVLSKWRTRSPKSILSSARNISWIVKDLRAYRQYDAIVAVGERVSNDMRSALIRRSLPSERVHLIPNGIDTALFKRDLSVRSAMRKTLGWSDAAPVIVSASRLHKQKGIDLGLNAFAALSKTMDNARYLIVGDGPERSELEAHASALGLKEKVRFVGSVQRDVLPRYLQTGDVLLFTTRHVEGLPLNVLEALAVGLSCVVSRHLFRDADFGRWLTRVQAQDESAVADGLRSALEVGTAASGVLPQHYSLDTCVDSYLALFERLNAQRAMPIWMGGSRV